MVVARAQRRQVHRPRFEQEFGHDATVALDVVDLAERAWHDSYGELTFPDKILEDLLLVAGGNIRELVAAACLAVTDSRDLQVAADELRSG